MFIGLYTPECFVLVTCGTTVTTIIFLKNLFHNYQCIIIILIHTFESSNYLFTISRVKDT